ncbi:MAG: phosphoribosylamine--glycine ligase [Flavobacteriales bacterium]
MNILLIGSGGREHALAWKMAQSSLLENLYIAPGNAGTRTVGTNVDIDQNDFEAIAEFCLEKNIYILVVGPEEPLVNGIHDYFSFREDLKGITVIGPKKQGAMLEGSKEFSKKFMYRHNIPTAKYASFGKNDFHEALAFLYTLKPPYVIKADGLAAGKGVVIVDNLSDAESELKAMLKGARFGKASERVVIEEFLTGIELSVFVLTDGKAYKTLPHAKDYKRIGEGDTGPNTGGMGAISPVPFANDDFMDKVENQVIIPTIKGLRSEGIDYQGFIFFGLINVKGDPYVIEYNARMGDPETEVVMPRLKSDLLDLFEGIATGTLSECDIEIDPRTVATVMLVSKGYPGEYEKGKELKGKIVQADAVAFHAGTKHVDGKAVTNGGRVVAISAYGKDIESAIEQCYLGVDEYYFENKHYRRDIGQDLLKTPQKA